MKIPGTNVPVEKQKDFYASLEQLRSYQKKPVLGKCMFWADNCTETPIASHLIPESWLRQIADATTRIGRNEIERKK
jgi:hypothetical protein